MTERRRRRREPAAGARRREAAVVSALSTRGEPLQPALRHEMERGLGHDFADVRVHAGREAADAAWALDAAAFTSGHHVVLAAGRYPPSSDEGRRLLAHELVHTLQQPEAPAGERGFDVSDALEREAATFAERVVAGETVPPGAVSLAAPAARGRVARQARTALAPEPLEVPESPDAVRAVADEVARLLVFDPDDVFGRVRRRLARLAPGTRSALVETLRPHIQASAAERLTEIVDRLVPSGPRSAGERLASRERPRPVDDRREAEPGGPGAEATGRDMGAEAGGPEVAPPVEAAAVAPSLDAPAAGALPADEMLEPPADEPVAAVFEPDLGMAESAPPPEAEPEPAAGEEVGRPAAAAAEAAPPAPAGVEEAGPEEGAAELEPVEATEAEALEAQDEAEAEAAEAEGEEAPLPEAGLVEPGAEEPAAPGAEEAAPPGAPSAQAEEAEAVAEAAPEPSGDAFEPESDPEVPEPEEVEPEQDEESVVEQPPAEPGVDEEAAEEPAAAEAAGAEELETGIEAEPDESPDAMLAEEEPAEEAEEAVAEAGADEGVGVPIEEPPEPEAPDTSEDDPVAAMDAVGQLPPAEAEAALGDVDAATTRSVGEQRSALAAEPPQLERPTGAPTAAELAAEAPAPAVPPAAPDRLERSSEPPAVAPTRPSPLPPAPPPATGRARPPEVAGGPKGELSADGERALRASIEALPVRDPGLDVESGRPPAVLLEGGADPQRAQDERAKLENAARTALADGRRALVQPAGEDRIVPRAAPETLRASMAAPEGVAPAEGTARPGAETATPTAAPSPAGDAASIIAREQRGPELRARAAEAVRGMVAGRAEHAKKAADERRRSQEEVTALVRDSAGAQATVRRDAREEVYDKRLSWSSAERDLAEHSLTDADRRLQSGVEEVTRLKSDADARAAAHIETGERDAEQARRQGEEKAAAERGRGEREVSGPLGWLADRATAFFDGVKQGITAAFEAARTAVRGAIERAKRLAVDAIDMARGAIVDAIRAAGDALIAIGDRLLADFPGLRERFRREIEERVAKAQAAVDRLADGVKAGVQKALDALGGALDAALRVLEKGLLLYVDAYRTAVTAALKFANRVIEAVGAFAVLVKHVAANPVQWLKNLAASAKDGVRNHLWKAFKAAIKRWFSEKVEEVLGLGVAVWNLLKKGGISLSRIGSMAWQAIKAAIPPTLIQILIEKLISLIVPAAGAVMIIIEGLQAAWGTVRRVIEAFERFFVFLKAVRTGRAGPQFANAVAAAAIAVIDFVANWLLRRLRKPAGKIAGKLRALAKKLGAKLGRAFKKGKALLKKRRKKPALKGRPTKKPKRDKRANAERRVTAATNFLSAQLARNRPRAVLFAQMLYARGRWRVRVRLREQGERARLAVEANPLKTLVLIEDYTGKLDIEDYRARAREYQGFLREGHHVHHIFARTHRDWWEAAGIDWNAPEHMLELPEPLHLRVLHASFKLLDRKGRTKSVGFYKRLNDAWTVAWAEWLVPNMTALMARFRLPPISGLLEGLSQSRRKAAQARMRAGANWVVRRFSRRLDLDLWDFRLGKNAWRRFAKRFADPLAKFERSLAKKASKAVKAAKVMRWKAKRAGPVQPLKALAKLITQYRKGT